MAGFYSFGVDNMIRRTRFDWFAQSVRQRHRAAKRRKAPEPLSRRLRLEPLEDRRLLSITVSTLVDENDGVGIGLGTSLREAIFAVTPNETINFDPALTMSSPGTIVLEHGELSITKSLAIQGPGANLLKIDASGNDPTPTVNNGDGSRVFNVADGIFGQFDVAISGLALTGGDMADSGGAIRNAENLTVTNLVINGNSAGTTSAGYHGGGIGNFAGNLTVQTSTISGNSLTFGRGGGIYSSFGSLTITDSTISGNAAGVSASGGGIYTSYSSTTISRSTISGNSATRGGGIALTGIDVVMTITNSTISGNSAEIDGSGVVVLFSSLNLKHSTVAGNRSDSDINGSGTGGGVFVNNSQFSHATIDQVIVAGNLRGTATRDDVAGAVTARFSLLGVNTGATITNQGGNLIGTAGSPIDPLLGPLAEHGGLTKTHALLTGSPAIDVGDPAATAGVGTVPLYDQRGDPFSRVFDGDGAGGARIDVGAYERQTVVGVNMFVDTLVDEYDFNFSPGDLSLREAVGLANGSIGGQVIMFDPGLTSGGPATILLTKGDLSITDPLSIFGPGAGLLTIDASGNDPTPFTNNGDGSRVFNIDDGSSALLDVGILYVTLTGGDAGGSGGAVFTRENLSVVSSTITGNATSANEFGAGGGGIYSSAGGTNPNSLVVLYSTITNNVAANSEGGGIRKRFGSLVVGSTTISGNTSFGVGGGISAADGAINIQINLSTFTNNLASGGGGLFFFDAVGNISDTTINSNRAPQGGGGGIYSWFGNLTIARSQVSGNSAVDGGGIVSYGTISVVDSTISANTATYGGGISHNQGNLSVNRSTISGNQANQGGGILSETNPGFSTTIRNSTISGNIGFVVGGGVFNAVGNTFINNSTITTNQAPDNFGGGVASRVSGTLTFVYSTIVANNFSGGDVQFVDGATNSFASGGHNLIGFGNAATAPMNVFFQIGDQAGVANPLLGPLADHGGPTQTHGLLAGSPAIDAGDTNNPPPSTFDQRGTPFVRVFDGDGVGGARIDIGAYERQTLPGLSLVVDTLDDEIDQVYLPGFLSLREAIGFANGSVGADTITFAASLTTAGTVSIQLFHGELAIDESLTIDGPAANLLTIDASGNDPTPTMNIGDGSRVFNIDDANNSLIDVTIAGLTVTGSDAAGQGGAIFTRENLTVADSLITGNATSSFGITGGGGIYSRAPIGSPAPNSLTVLDSAITNNVAVSSEGAGIRKRYGSLLIERSTIAGNQAFGVGGGISVSDGNVSVQIRDSTISGNSSGLGSANGFGGGGIFLSGAVALLARSTISDNEAAFTGGGMYARLSSLTIEDSTITNNESMNSEGGGIRQLYGSLTVERSTIAGNSAWGPGGGISAASGILVAIRNTTISGNSSASGGSSSFGGGGLLLFNATATITNSTLSGNSANFNGGAIFAFSGQLTVAHSTIAQNRSDADSNASGSGGGISVGNLQTVTLDHTVVAGNLRAASTRDDVAGTVSARFSLLGDSTGATVVDNGGNLIGTGGTPIDPLLGPLAGNGGPTLTHALLVGSPAIDVGEASAIAGVGNVPLFDERGTPFTRVFNGDGVGTARLDVGAFERQAVPPSVYGDYNHNGLVDAADYTLWRNTLGGSVTAYDAADGSGNGTIGPEDYAVWKSHFGQTLPMGSGGVAGSAAESPPAEIAAGAAGIARLFESFALSNAGANHQRSEFRTPALNRVSWRRDEALAAWLAQQIFEERERADRRFEVEEFSQPSERSVNSPEAVAVAFGRLGESMPDELF